MTAYGLIAGLAYNDIIRLTPGAVLDLYVYRQRYDDEQHQLSRKKDLLLN